MVYIMNLIIALSSLLSLTLDFAFNWGLLLDVGFGLGLGFGFGSLSSMKTTSPLRRVVMGGD
jgi:hypothetical protein